MSHTTLISSQDLAHQLHNPNWVVVDCRFLLKDPGGGRAAYQSEHIPGAVYAHLDEDLTGPITEGITGRHPLPTVESFTRTLSRWGVGDDVQVVVYDDMGGALAAARCWWMLRWLGHEHVAVLDGGWNTWCGDGYSTDASPVVRDARDFRATVNTELLVDAAFVETIRTDPDWRLVDARAADRFRGENETVDPVAGHIPGAVSMPFSGNLDGDGRFKSVTDLRELILIHVGNSPPEKVVHYCGSGVTAAHNLLAMAHAGFEGARLYPGSWSEWITEQSRLVARP